MFTRDDISEMVGAHRVIVNMTLSQVYRFPSVRQALSSAVPSHPCVARKGGLSVPQPHPQGLQEWPDVLKKVETTRAQT
jgi:molybdate-binding protein